MKLKTGRIVFVRDYTYDRLDFRVSVTEEEYQEILENLPSQFGTPAEVSDLPDDLYQMLYDRAEFLDTLEIEPEDFSAFDLELASV